MQFITDETDSKLPRRTQIIIVSVICGLLFIAVVVVIWFTLHSRKKDRDNTFTRELDEDTGDEEEGKGDNVAEGEQEGKKKQEPLLKVEEKERGRGKVRKMWDGLMGK